MEDTGALLVLLLCEAGKWLVCSPRCGRADAFSLQSGGCFSVLGAVSFALLAREGRTGVEGWGAGTILSLLDFKYLVQESALEAFSDKAAHMVNREAGVFRVGPTRRPDFKYW